MGQISWIPELTIQASIRGSWLIGQWNRHLKTQLTMPYGWQYLERMEQAFPEGSRCQNQHTQSGVIFLQHLNLQVQKARVDAGGAASMVSHTAHWFPVLECFSLLCEVLHSRKKGRLQNNSSKLKVKTFIWPFEVLPSYGSAGWEGNCGGHTWLSTSLYL